MTKASNKSKAALADLYVSTISRCKIPAPTAKEVAAIYPRAVIEATDQGYNVVLGAETYSPATVAILTLRIPDQPRPQRAARRTIRVEDDE